MKIFATAIIIQYHCKEHTHILLVFETAMIQPVIFSIKRHPVVLIHSLRVVEVVDAGIGNPAMIGHLFGIDPEIDHGVSTGMGPQGRPTLLPCR